MAWRHRDRLCVLTAVLCALLAAPASTATAVPAQATPPPVPQLLSSVVPHPLLPAAPHERPGRQPVARPQPVPPPATPWDRPAGRPTPSGAGAVSGREREREPSDPSPRPLAQKVLRLYEDAARATAAYERGRRASLRQRAEADRLRARVVRERRSLDELRDKLGAVAREQYRTGGPLADAARLLLAEDPDTLLRGYRIAAQTQRAVNRLLDRTDRARARFARQERRARAAWRELAEHEARLAAVKRGVETTLEAAQWMLQSEADRRVAAGACAGAVRLDQPPLPEGGPAWVAPVEDYWLSAGFARSGGRWAHRHTGQDFAVGIGAPVRSVGAGRVVKVSCGGAFGIEIVVRHGDGSYTQYAHLAGLAVDQGERVRTGQWIGQVGTTGNSTGPHLHFEARITPHLGSGVDPVAWLRERGVRL
ncbi:peptidoglycan DD-metalloendopeptidase family protein [Streptomyces sp. C10-9-1]|uniref:M23 family metallopeptidase n=1 Tax=Streptomyces sp. C10-9-1 TaxID=1859285 RepID=UPI003D72AC74